MAVALVIALRLVVPLSILRWPIGGALVSMALDAVDVVLVDAFARILGEPGEFGPLYPQIDKWLDLWYLSLEAWVVRRWPEPLLRRTAWTLFAWRVIGVVLFELTAIRPLLLAFPNLFENVYLYVAIVRRYAPRYLPRSLGMVLLLLVILLIPKLIQEWILHWDQLHPWLWLRSILFGTG